MAFKTILHVRDISTARVLVAALKAHGFHPLDGGDGGLPGVVGDKGTPVLVPEEEAGDATVLAADLLREMER